MLRIDDAKTISIDVDGKIFSGDVTGTVEDWHFKSSQSEFIEQFPDGELYLLDLGNKSSILHKGIGRAITKKVNEMLNM